MTSENDKSFQPRKMEKAVILQRQIKTLPQYIGVDTLELSDAVVASPFQLVISNGGHLLANLSELATIYEVTIVYSLWGYAALTDSTKRSVLNVLGEKKGSALITKIQCIKFFSGI